MVELNTCSDIKMSGQPQHIYHDAVLSSSDEIMIVRRGNDNINSDRSPCMNGGSSFSRLNLGFIASFALIVGTLDDIHTHAHSSLFI